LGEEGENFINHPHSPPKKGKRQLGAYMQKHERGEDRGPQFYKSEVRGGMTDWTPICRHGSSEGKRGEDDPMIGKGGWGGVPMKRGGENGSR